jgi:hypothetical protein
MKDTDYNKLFDFALLRGGLIPINQPAIDLVQQTHESEVLTFKEVTVRDLSFHRCYMSLISYIWGYLPLNFKQKVPKENFYMWLKHLKGQYEVLFEFKDGTKMVQYESISFARMSQKKFEDYIREQLPYIYENVIGAFFSDQQYRDIIDTIEEDYKQFFDKLQ